VLTAEAARYALDARLDALKVSLLAHAEAQGGRGSGGDVAACFAGTLVRYRRYDVKPLLDVAGSGALGRAWPTPRRSTCSVCPSCGCPWRTRSLASRRRPG